MTKQIPLSQGRFALVDDADYESLSKHRWHLRSNGYAARCVGRNTKIYLQREIMDAAPGEIVDHIDGDKLNNRRANLRLVTPAQNTRNRQPIQGKQFKGIYWHKSNKRWHVRIQHEGQRVELGYYLEAENAARAYDAASLLLHGEYGWRNFPGEPIPDDIQAKVLRYLARYEVA